MNIICAYHMPLKCQLHKSNKHIKVTCTRNQWHMFWIVVLSWTVILCNLLPYEHIIFPKDKNILFNVIHEIKRMLCPLVHGYPIRVMEMHTSRLGSWQSGDNYGLWWGGIWRSAHQISRMMKMKSSCLEKKSKQLDHRIRQLVDGGHLASFRMKEKKRLKGILCILFWITKWSLKFC